MKKFLLALLFSVITIVASAQTINFRTTSFTYKERTYSGWSNWAPTEASNMLLTMDLDNDLVVIYSPTTQIYSITSYDGTSKDRDGDTTAKYHFIDQDGDRGVMRLVMRRSGKSEIYIDFSNVIWVYSVLRL